MASLCEIDRALEVNLGGLEEMNEDDDGDMEALSLKDDEEIAREDSETLPEAGARVEDIHRSEVLADGDTRALESIVSDDGEQFWVQKQRVEQEMNDTIPLAATTNSQNKNDGKSRDAWPERISQMRKSAVLVPAAAVGMATPQIEILSPSSTMGTPMSLYDENGFLKG
jgi:hypothetical protein